MIPEAVLDELVRTSPLQRPLVEMAWPALDTASRLQVITAIQGDGLDRYTPDWLATLAFDDPHALVRYWAARGTSFRTKSPHDKEGIFKLDPPSDEQEALYAKVSADPEPLVRFCRDQNSLVLNFSPLTGMIQTERLLFIRNMDSPSEEAFFDWLADCVEAGLPDADLRECAQEFFILPVVQKSLSRGDRDFHDGWDEHSAGQAMRKGWELTKHAGPALTGCLAYNLPTDYGFGTMTVDELAALPAEAIGALTLRNKPSETILAVLARIEDHPDQFSPEVVEQIKDYASLRAGDDEVDEYQYMHAPRRQDAILQAILGLKREVRSLKAALG